MVTKDLSVDILSKEYFSEIILISTILKLSLQTPSPVKRFLKNALSDLQQSQRR